MAVDAYRAHAARQHAGLGVTIAPIGLTTERLTVTIPTVDLAESMAGYSLHNREHHALSGPPREAKHFTADFWRSEFAAKAERAASDRSYEFVLLLRGKNEVVGTISLSNLVRGVFQAAHLGYTLDRNAVGNGYMHEALTAVIAYAFDGLGLHRIIANYMPENLRSAAVLERLGFVKEGYARDYLFLGGAWRDHVLTALLRGDILSKSDGAQEC